MRDWGLTTIQGIQKLESQFVGSVWSVRWIVSNLERHDVPSLRQIVTDLVDWLVGCEI